MHMMVWKPWTAWSSSNEKNSSSFMRSKFQTMVVRGTREASQGRSWPFEATMKGDKFLMSVRVPQQGTVSSSVSGTTGWAVNSERRRALTPSEVADGRRAAQLMGVVKFTPSETMRVAGRRRVGERDALVVVDRPSEGVQRRYFFDAQTGLLLRIVTLTDAILNQLPEQMDFEDYRDVDGVKLPSSCGCRQDTFFSYTRKTTEVNPTPRRRRRLRHAKQQ